MKPNQFNHKISSKISTGPTDLEMYKMDESVLDIITMNFKDVMDKLGDCPICVILLFVLLIRFSIDIVRLLRFYGPKSKVEELFDAIRKNDTHQALTLLEPSLINVVMCKDDGYTPFLMACMNGNTVLVNAMLNRGADINTRTTLGENAFYLAAFNCICNLTSKDASCVRALYHAGVDINSRTHKGYNPLQMAAMFGHAGLVLWLVEKGADVNTRPTPYELLIRFGFPDIAENLLGLMTRKRLLRRS